MFFANSSFLTGNRNIICIQTKRNVEPVLMLVPRVKAFALPCLSETSNAESPTYVYIYCPAPSSPDRALPRERRGMDIIHSHEASPLLCF